MMNKAILLIPLLISLSGCGGDNEKKIDDGGVQTPPDIQRQTNSISTLTVNGDTSAARYYRNGIYINQKQPNRDIVYAQSENAVKSSDADYSQAITQEVGVDESDRFHYNGQQLFLAGNARNEFNSSDNNSDFLRILERQDDNSLTKLSDTSIVIKDEQQSISGLFVNKKKVSVITSQPYIMHTLKFDVFSPVNREFSLSFYDVADLAQPQLTQQLTIDGHVISSRQIDNKIYLVSTFSPNIDDIIVPSLLTGTDEALFTAINDLSIDEISPHYTDLNGKKRALVDINSCLLPQSATSNDGYNSLVILSVIDTQSPNEITTTCVNADVQGVYVSKDSVYIYGSESQIQSFDIKSVIHKFDITTTTANYRASAIVAGHFGFTNSHLRFNEKDDYLTVVSTRYDSDYLPIHQLAVFKDNNTQTMDLVGQLPNAQQPDAIGKPNEKIYAVRYFNDKAYIVTFLRTDPLYVIDLSKPESPLLQGALEIPGYSAYLHPISDNLLLGIGQNVQIREGNNDDLPEVEEGAQVSLFDVSNPKAPMLLGSKVYKDSYTPVEFNYQALSYINSGDGMHRVALPIEKWTTSTLNGENRYQLDSSLELLEINDKVSPSTLRKVGAMKVNDQVRQQYYNNNDARSIIQSENVYYIQGNRVYQSLWNEPENVLGPFE
jgi:uncharacterized secreted protein with C-terminal beta-propeller domain